MSSFLFRSISISSGGKSSVTTFAPSPVLRANNSALLPLKVPISNIDLGLTILRIAHITAHYKVNRLPMPVGGSVEITSMFSLGNISSATLNTAFGFTFIIFSSIFILILIKL